MHAAAWTSCRTAHSMHQQAAQAAVCTACWPLEWAVPQLTQAVTSVASNNTHRRSDSGVCPGSMALQEPGPLARLLAFRCCQLLNLRVCLAPPAWL